VKVVWLIQNGTFYFRDNTLQALRNKFCYHIGFAVGLGIGVGTIVGCGVGCGVGAGGGVGKPMGTRDYSSNSTVMA